MLPIHSHRFLRITGNSIFASFIARGIWIVTQFLVTRIIFGDLQTDNYGIYAFIFSFIALGIFCDFGYGRTLQHRLSESNTKAIESDLENLCGIFIVCWTIGTTLIGAILLIATQYKLIKINLDYLPLIALLGAGYGAIQIYLRALNGIDHGSRIYFIQAIFGIFFLGIVLIAKLISYSLSPYQYGCLYYGLYIISHFLLASFILKISCRPQIDSALKTILTKLYQSRLFFIYILISIATTQLDSFYLGFAGRYSDLAYYSLVSKIFLAVCYSFTYVFFTISQPKITRHFGSKGSEGLQSLFMLMLIKALIGVFLFIAIFQLLKYQFLPIIAPGIDLDQLDDLWIFWFYGYFILRISLECFEFFFIAIKQPKMPIKIGACLALCIALCLAIIIKYYGLLGMLQGLCLFYGVALIFYLFSIRKFFLRGF